MSEFESSDMEPQLTDTAKSAIIWGIVAIALSIVILVFNNSPLVLAASVWLKIGAFFVAAPLGLIGAMLGDGIRRFAAPDMIFTSGGMGSLMWQKVFWSIGPQTIGCVIGCGLGSVLVLG